MSFTITSQFWVGITVGVAGCIFATWMNPFLPLVVIGVLTGQRIF
jgi:hypothetical protein